MICFTQLPFVRPGQEETFLRFEAAVLPLLARHGGRLLYRVRPDPGCVVESAIGTPYEIHLVAFDSREAFEAYASDPDRQAATALKEASVERVVSIEGVAPRAAQIPSK